MTKLKEEGKMTNKKKQNMGLDLKRFPNRGTKLKEEKKV
jgi:hypothetical protein